VTHVSKTTSTLHHIFGVFGRSSILSVGGSATRYVLLVLRTTLIMFSHNGQLKVHGMSSTYIQSDAPGEALKRAKFDVYDCLVGTGFYSRNAISVLQRTASKHQNYLKLIINLLKLNSQYRPEQ